MHVTSDTVLTTIDLNEALEVYVPVSLDRSRDLKLGLPLQILDVQGALLASAQVTFISPRVDDQTQSILVKARLAGDGRLRSSQNVRARIVWRRVEALAIPVLSVVRINGQPFVFVAEEKDGRLVASQRRVRGRANRGQQHRRDERAHAGRTHRRLGRAEARQRSAHQNVIARSPPVGRPAHQGTPEHVRRPVHRASDSGERHRRRDRPRRGDLHPAAAHRAVPAAGGPAGHRQQLLHGRQRGDRRDGGDAAARAGHQRRAGHDLHVVDQRERRVERHHRDLRRDPRSRPRGGRRAEPRQSGERAVCPTRSRPSGSR